jgi:hypothetical protein
VASFDVSNDLFFGNWFDTSTIKKVSCSADVLELDPLPHLVSNTITPTSWLRVSRDPKPNEVFSYISSLAINTTAILVDDQKDMTCI